MARKGVKVVATRLPQSLGDKFDEALKKGPYLTPAEFLRAAVAEKLQRMEAV